MDGTQSAWAKHPEGKCYPDIVSSLALLNEKLLHKMAINLHCRLRGGAQYRWRMVPPDYRYHGLGGTVRLPLSS